MPQRAPYEQFALGTEQIASLLDASEELPLFVSPDGSILFAGSGLAKLVGRPAEELAGLSVFHFLHEDDRPVLQRLLRETRYAPKVRGLCRLRTAGGDFQWFNAVTIDRLKDPAIQGFILLLTDASAAHRMGSERNVISEVLHVLHT